MVPVAGLLGAFCGRTLLGRRLGLWRTLVVVQSCSGNSAVIDPSQQLNPSISPCHTAIHSLTSSSLERLCQPCCIYSHAASSLSPQTASLYLTSSSHISLSPSLSLTCSLSHASALPSSFPSFFHRCADSAYPSSSHLHHFSSLSHSAYFEALLPDLIKAPCCSLPSSEFRM